MVRDGIRSMLESQNHRYNFKVQEAASGEEGVSKAVKDQYDIIIMDYQLPDMSGAEAAQKILKNAPEANILALSNYNEYMYIDRMVKAGVKGFVLKNISPEELIGAIETIISGRNYYSNDVALKLLNFAPTKEDHKPKPVNDLKKLLTKREYEIMEFVAAGQTTEQIAKKLSLSKRTVDSHRHAILSKLNIKSVAALIKYVVDSKN
jgi:DNA-binding NarL/FixJ family response regulator